MVNGEWTISKQQTAISRQPTRSWQPISEGRAFPNGRRQSRLFLQMKVWAAKATVLACGGNLAGDYDNPVLNRRNPPTC